MHAAASQRSNSRCRQSAVADHSINLPATTRCNVFVHPMVRVSSDAKKKSKNRKKTQILCVERVGFVFLCCCADLRRTAVISAGFSHKRHASVIPIFSSVDKLHCITHRYLATLNSAVCWLSRKQMWPQGTGAAAPRTRSPFLIHSLRCSDGLTALKWAIDFEKVEIVKYLVSIGAPQ